MPFSLYIHIPYCLRICPYCDFNAYGGQTWPEERYINALEAEFRYSMAQAPWQGDAIETIYFGGGTPSLFAPASIERFLHVVAELCPLGPDLEVTLEADPASVTRETLVGFRAIGINRLSLGIQSFQPTLLKTLGRLHGREAALQAIDWARAAGFGNLNLDLMFAVPGQTFALLEKDLAQAFARSPEHISVYNLTYEENTPFFALKQKGLLQPLDEEDEVAMYTLVQEQGAAQGYQHYEISNFALPGFFSRHNTHYWTGESYLGLGAGAHSFARTPAWGKRWSNERIPKRYMARALTGEGACSTIETLTQTQARGEFVFLNLRQTRGFASAAFADRFQQNLIEVFPHVADLLTEGLLTEEAGQIRLTPRGLLVADTIFASFF